MTIGNGCSFKLNDDFNITRCVVFYSVRDGSLIFLKASVAPIFTIFPGHFEYFIWCGAAVVNAATNAQPFMISWNMGSDGELKCKKFHVDNGGYIYVAGAGVNFFPGDVAGEVDTSTYSWYK